MNNGRLLLTSVVKDSKNATLALSTSATIDLSNIATPSHVVTGGTGTAKVEAYIGTTAVDVTSAGIIEIPATADKVVITETGGLNSITYSISFLYSV